MDPSQQFWTYSMLGEQGGKGGIARQEADAGVKCVVYASFTEIYNDRVYDLLQGSQTAVLIVREAAGGLCVPEALRQRVYSTAALLELIQNSHLLLVDLAGSESTQRAHHGSADRAGCAINKGLMVLGRVLEALASGSDFVPFRDSALTQLLKPGLVGNCRTWMLATLSPDRRDVSESLSTLRYAARAQRVNMGSMVAPVCFEEEDKEDVMRGDERDSDSRKDRRGVYLTTKSFGEIFARVAGRQETSNLVCTWLSSLQWNFLVPPFFARDESATTADEGSSNNA